MAPGTRVTLSWSYERTAEAYLDPGNIPLACPPCTYIVTPAETTTYRLRAYNAVGSDEETVTVVVTARPVVTAIPIVITYNFIAQAPAAQWISQGTSSPECPETYKELPFGGPDTNPCGFAMYREGRRVEGGTIPPGKILEMHPKWVDDGLIRGHFPPYTVQSGDHFRAEIGFLLKPDGTCGVGNAIFALDCALVSGAFRPLGSWTETCDGALRSVDVNLSDIAGQNVQFVFYVLANGPAAQDWAVWVKPRIERP